MPLMYELILQSVDFLGKTRDWEFTVIASGEAERNEELASVMSMHEEVDSWSIKQVTNTTELNADSPHVADFRSKGAHSFYQ